MSLDPVIAVHATAAVLAVIVGPVALWARRGRQQHPKMHRAFGYAWVTLMVVTALSALFIQSRAFPHIAGFSPIHLLIPVTLAMLFTAFYKLAKGDIGGHRAYMQRLYLGACVVAGAFTLLPGRFLGHLVWSSVGLV